MQKAHYLTKPSVLSVELGYGITKRHYTIATNIIELPHEKSEIPTWEADVYTFWEEPENISEEDIKSNPEKYMNYIPVDNRAELQKKYTDAIQLWLDTTVHTRGYDDIFTAITYADSDIEKFAAEGKACKKWRDHVWFECYAYLDAVLAGEKELVSIEELIELLPKIDW